ncbi:hypothetical protein N5I82_02210 [Klebsiella quasipneumoniae]|nr:hypothetical protein [Klebsiella quasipneumoniae]HDZ9751345.1 hypothetical protein [Klebsiella quasipneumoniae subsp. similipneumoniae]EKY4129452.1 hypothetical protein [Klebsiella quasipneumoniae]EMB9113948.1 hypothetical protein [Klebsiella quasipneumoniae]EME4043969.1 hypothetical protein [Klebsiella quasipneumoniae]MBC4926508.1 hypothetical protein [Klebsiella quasipneumoniae]
MDEKKNAPAIGFHYETSPADFVSLWNVFAKETVKMRAGALFFLCLKRRSSRLAQRAEKNFLLNFPRLWGKSLPLKGDGKGIMRQRSGSGSQS